MVGNYRALIKQGVQVSILCGERLEAFEAYRKHGAFHPQSFRVVGFFALVVGVAYLLLLLLQHIDRWLLPGVGYIQHIIALYIVFCVLRLYIVCEWCRTSAMKRGLKFEPRTSFVVSREEETLHLETKLKDIGSSPKHSKKPPKIICITGYGGGGHEATMNGVRTVMAEAGFKADFVDLPVAFLVETDDLNPLWRVYHVTGEQLYNWGLRQGALVAWLITWVTSYLQYWALHADEYLGQFLDALGLPLCCQIWTEQKPDLILNFTTGTSRFISNGLKRAGMLHIPVLVVISDFEGTGVHSWIQSKTDNVLCGTSLCRQQALQFGVPPNQVYQISGMILRPSFYDHVRGKATVVDRSAKVAELGLDPTKRTCLVFWGGVGNRKLMAASLALLNCKHQLNLILLCGHNKPLYNSMKQIKWPNKVIIEEYTPNVSFYMEISDMIVCKPGPGVTSEAALLGLPILVEWSPFTLPQEVAVCKWIISRGLGLSFTRSKQISGLVDSLCDMMGEFEPTRKLRPVPIPEAGMTGVDISPSENKAIFEIPAVVQSLLVDYHGKPPGSESPMSQSSPTRQARRDLKFGADSPASNGSPGSNGSKVQGKTE